MEESLDEDNEDNEEIEQDYVYIDYFTDGIYHHSRDKKEFLCKQTIIMKTLKNEIFFPQHKMNLVSSMKQFSADFFRCNIYIGSPEKKAGNPEELFKYIENNPFLKVNRDNVLLICGQTIMLFPLYLLFKVVGSIVLGERKINTGLQIHISPTKILVIKYLRAVDPSDISKTLRTFEVFLDIDFAYDETTIIVAIE